ncbi:FAD-dependent oxidoreductase [Streptomyces sp. SID5469]|nr:MULTISPECIES: FAD-dependent oxidoreductase [Streptomyces]MYS98190.1 FAD-dependent oxidoreductase [Streptomyces sp. SID5469]
MSRWTTSLSEAQPVPYWLDDPGRPRPEPALTGAETCDLLVVGGGYSGLWTALLAKERDPGRDVVLLEGREVGWAASGRNGGFCAASLTHGLANGLARWPDEIGKLEELGARNLDEIEAAVARYSLDCDFERTGEIDVATEPHQAEELRAWYEKLRRKGLADGIDLLDAGAVREQVDSPTFLAGLHDRGGVAMLHPAKLAWGLKRACLGLGVRVYEHTPALNLEAYGAGMAVRTPYGSIRARRVALGTNIFPNLIKRVRAYTVPVYDYALMTEPLTDDQLAAVGWKNRQGTRGQRQPVPLLPALRRQPDPVGRLRRDLPLRRPGTGRVRRPPRDVRQARRALLHLLPAAGGRPLHARVGRRDRHLLALLGVLRHRAPGKGRVRGGLHGPRRRGDPVRRGRDAGPAGGGAHGAHRAGDGPQEAAALPAGAVRLDGHRAHQVVAGTRGRARRPAEPLAEGHGQAGSGLRQLTLAVARGRVAFRSNGVRPAPPLCPGSHRSLTAGNRRRS